MENRRPVHYEGNTLAPPAPGRKNRRKRQATPQGRIMPGTEDEAIEFKPKTVAMLRCVWCGADLGHYRIRCNNCGNCQHCGHLIDTDRGCRYCGNRPDFNIRPKRGRGIKRRIFGRSDGPKHKSRAVRLAGPQTRSRRPKSA